MCCSNTLTLRNVQECVCVCLYLLNKCQDIQQQERDVRDLFAVVCYCDTPINDTTQHYLWSETTL